MATTPSPTRFRIGYATSGFANHRLEDAIDVIAGLGYRALTLTLDVHHLDPFAPDLAGRAAAVRRRLEAADLGVVVECGARFILDPWRKHRPGLLDPDRARREEFMRLAIGVAADLGADCVSFWSGARPETMTAGEAFVRLREAVGGLVEHASSAGVDLAFEPEPGMFVETVAAFGQIHAALGAPKRLGLSLDVGHVIVTAEGDPATIIREQQARLFTVALEDMRPRVHEHLPFGLGVLDLAAVVAALNEVGFARIASVELPRHGADAVRWATHSRDALRAAGVSFRA
jgi:L-ribulose-5-phosphate 3-epimerase